MEKKYLFDLTKDCLHDTLKAGITKSQANDTIRKGLVEMNGGSTKFSIKSFRRNPELYDFIEEIIPNEVASGLKGNEFFMQFVDEKNLAEGDGTDYRVKKDSIAVVSNIARGTKGLRRQRIGREETVSVIPTMHGVKLYDEFTRLATGRIDLQELIDTIVNSIIKQRMEDIYLAWYGVTQSAIGANYYPAAGSYSEDVLLDLCAKTEAANDGSDVFIIATLKGARKIGADCASKDSDEAKSDMYNKGYATKWNGINVMVVPQKYKRGTETFMFDDNEINVVPVNMDKPIKQTIGGEDYFRVGEVGDNDDMTIDMDYLSAWGTAVVVGKKFSKYKITN